MKGKKEGRDDGQTIVRGWSGWSKLTVTTSIRSLGKNFLSTGADQSRDAKASRESKRIFNRIAILETLSPSFSHNEDATAISLFRFSPTTPPTKSYRLFPPNTRFQFWLNETNDPKMYVEER